MALVVAMGACSGGGHSGSPAPSASGATPSPTPTDVSADLALAASLYSHGDFEQAIAIYSAAAQRSTGDQRLNALWSLARAAYAHGDKPTAESALQAFLAAGPDPDRGRLALLLLGTVQDNSGESDAARQTLTQYIQADGPAAAYVQLQLADLANGRKDISAAVEHVDLALAAGLPAQAQIDARFSLARYQDSAGDTADARETYRRIADSAPADDDRAEALWQLAALDHRDRDEQGSAQALHSLVDQYPGSQHALEALDQPQLALSPLSAMQRATVLFKHRSNDDAAKAFADVLADPAAAASAPTAHYDLGILAERASNPDGALNEYGAAIALLSDGRDPALLGQALWDRATVLDGQGRADDAAAAYAAVADQASGSEHAAEGLFQSGLIRYRQGRPADAAALWRRYLAAVADAALQARAHFWLAKAAQAAGDGATAKQELSAAAAAARLDYYGLRGSALLAGSALPAAAAAVKPLSPDWSRVEDWLRAWAGPEDAAARAALFTGAAWQRALELERSGLADQSQVEFQDLLEQATAHPWLLYRFARATADEGLVSFSARAAGRLANQHAGAPPDVLALAYPLAYVDLATDAASQYGFSPLLLLALVRQESLYDAGAVSPAGALGLTQVMPATGEGIAAELKDSAFQDADLLRARVSLKFGAHYLGAQLSGFGGNVAAALAAYNGGPANAGHWLDLSGADPDVFVESIGFSETSAYVEIVLENYAMYLYAYGLMTAPSLPLP